MNKRTPLVSVVMPTYNAEKYVAEAINSVLGQTLENFEFIIIDDGSTDTTLSIIKKYKDPRIILIGNTTNKGLVFSLNRGFKKARGKYIARMDNDDICLNNRFEKQIRFLENNPDIIICGAWIRNFGKKNYTWKTPIEHEAIRARMLFQSSIAHPSVMIKRSFLQQSKLTYQKEYIHAEDYAFWVKAGEKARLHNYPEVLLLYRNHQNQTPMLYSSLQQRSSWKTRRYQLKKLGIEPSKQDQRIHQSLSNWSKELYPRDFLSIGRWLKLLLIQNYKKKYYSQLHLALVIGERWIGMLALYYKQNIFILLFVVLYPGLSLFSLCYLVVRFLKIKK